MGEKVNMGEKVKIDGKEVKIKREPKVFYFVGADGIYQSQRGQKGTTFLPLYMKPLSNIVFNDHQMLSMK